uniref:hypothetical protein n=1 Tax=Phaeobacter sp. BS34 TaxID=2907240 RepID=UPI003703C296
MGGTFAVIAVLVKFLQPTLLIAILEHGNIWFFGLPLSVVALTMMAIELMAKHSSGPWAIDTAHLTVSALCFHLLRNQSAGNAPAAWQSIWGFSILPAARRRPY